jgi:hypothetical protein
VSDDTLREALRDLIPDYTGPQDPMPRVAASVRRRRVRQRTLLTVGAAGLAAVLAVAAPALLLPGRTGGAQSAAPYTPDTGPTGPAPTVYPVAAGMIDGAGWAIGTATLSAGAQRCLISDDDVFWHQLTCFDGWTAGSQLTWKAQPLADRGLAATRIVGVAPAGTTAVRVRLGTGAPIELSVRVTPTDRSARFFGIALKGTMTVRDVTALDAGGRAIGRPVADTGSGCPGSAAAACSPPG